MNINNTTFAFRLTVVILFLTGLFTFVYILNISIDSDYADYTMTERMRARWDGTFSAVMRQRLVQREAEFEKFEKERKEREQKQLQQLIQDRERAWVDVQVAKAKRDLTQDMVDQNLKAEKYYTQQIVDLKAKVADLELRLDRLTLTNK